MPSLSERDCYRLALEQIRDLWLHPGPAQRQDVAFQEAVRIASIALGPREDVIGGEDVAPGARP